MSSRRYGISCICGLLMSIGCGESTGRVTGRVLLDGQPAGAVDVGFTSLSSREDEYAGLSRPDGVYQLSYRESTGLQPGTYAVTITRYTLPNGRPLPEGEQGDVQRNDGKTRRTSYHFEQEVAAGDNLIDFELSKAPSETTQ